MAIILPLAKAIPPYPAEDVAAVLQDELLRTMRARARRKGQTLPKKDDEAVMQVIEIDSLTVVELLCSLDDILPFKATESVVKPGGYESVTAAVDHIVEGIERKWKKHHAGGKK